MSLDNVPLCNLPNGPSAVQFCANKDFQTLTYQQTLDSAFLGCEKRPWMKQRPMQDARKERETIMTLLTTSGDNARTSNVEKLLAENITFRDLGSLTDGDLKFFGFKTDKERNDLMNMFATMPNQDPSYDHVCNTLEARGYNNHIVGKAANHLSYMRSSLAATNYKLQVMPPEDMILGDKYYASRFALEALKSVQTISDELANDLKQLQKLNAKNNQKCGDDATRKERYIKYLYRTLIVLGTACAWYWWLTKHNRSSNLENISLKI